MTRKEFEDKLMDLDGAAWAHDSADSHRVQAELGAEHDRLRGLLQALGVAQWIIDGADGPGESGED